MFGKVLTESTQLLRVTAFAAICLVFLALLWPIIDFTTDDAYITFRYSRNLANGLGLVYNPGEYVEGYTNFLWVLLLAPFSAVGASLEIVAKTLSILFSIGTLFLVFQFPKVMQTGGRLPLCDFIAPLLLVINVSFLTYIIAGLETSLFTFLVCLAIYKYCQNPQAKLLPSIIFVATLVRPEGILIAAVIGVFCFITVGRGGYQKLAQNWFLLYILPVILYQLFRIWYFDSWLPNSYYAKTGSLLAQIFFGIQYILGFSGSLGYLYLPLIPLLLLLLLERGGGRRYFLLIFALSLGYTTYIILVGGDWMKQFRFFHPLLPLIALLYQESLRAFFARFDRQDFSRELRFTTHVLRSFVVVGIVIFSFAQYPFGIAEVQKEKQFWEGSAGVVGAWLADFAKEGSEIALGDIGEIGYLSNLRVFDTLGLVTPEVSKLSGGYTTKDPAELVRLVVEREPEYLLLIGKGSVSDANFAPSFDVMQRLLEDSNFMQSYEFAMEARVHSDNYYWRLLQHKVKTAGTKKAVLS